MEIVHSGFDSIYFAVQGALSPSALKRFESLKKYNPKDSADISFQVDDSDHRYFLQSSGKRGGYAYVINTGLCGSAIGFKNDLSRETFNGFVEISSACLVANGWRQAIEQELDHVKALGFHVVAISMNRADYCIDFLNAGIEIDPREFVAHSRVQKKCYYEANNVTNHIDIRTVSQSNSIKSITLGKMPNRQIILYDKRAEIILRRKFYWFDAWGIDRHDPTQTVHRVEVRAGKKHLLFHNIRTLEDFERSIGRVLTKAVKAIRWVKPLERDANISRAPLHPLWHRVQTHMDDALAPHLSPINERVITLRLRENKALQYKQQITGNLGGYLGVKGVEPEDMKTKTLALINEVTAALSNDTPSPLLKSYHKTRDKWIESHH